MEKNIFRVLVVLALIVTIGVINEKDAKAAETTIYDNTGFTYSQKDCHEYGIVIYDNQGYRYQWDQRIETMDLREDEALELYDSLFNGLARPVMWDMETIIESDLESRNDRVYIMLYVDGVLDQVKTMSRLEMYEEMYKEVSWYDEALEEYYATESN